MKRILSILLSLTICLTLLPAAAPVHAASVNDLNYKIINGQVTITDCEESASGSLTIPDTINGYPVTSIGDEAFYWCTSLTSVTIPDSVTSIGDFAFFDCTSLTSVTIPDSVTSIGDWAFSGCDSLTSVTIPDSVTSIGDWAFSWCSSLTSVTIPDSVTSIGKEAFYKCTSLTSVTIPDSVTSIGDHAFSGCDSLTGIIVSENNPSYSSDSYGVLYTKDKATVIQVPGATSGTYTIPDSVTSIGNYAFSDCTSLTSVTIPDSVTSIGGWAFSDCTSLTNVTIPDSVTSIGYSAFSYCTSLTSVTIPDSVTSIGDGAFSYCTGLTSVTIPDSVTSIWDGAFYKCTSLTNVTIPDSVTRIGKHAFSYCASLTSVTIPDSITSIDYWAFCYCSRLTSIYFVGNAPSIIPGAFYGVTATAYYHAGTSRWADATPGNWTYDSGQITLQEVDHIWSSFTYDNNHTCTINGTERATCISCGAADVREVPDTAAHRYVDGICSLCGLKENYGFLCGSLTTFGEGNALLELYTAGERVYSQELVDGVYETEDVPQGEYILSVSKAGHTTQTCTITVGEGETVLNIKLHQKGDVTGDGRLNMADVARAFAHVRGKNPITDDYVMLCADATGDGRINMGDVAKIYTLIKSK